MRVSIGILAWNEESSIAATLSSVFGQSLLGDGLGGRVEHVQVICVPNGCSDRTESVAREAMEAATAGRQAVALATDVCALDVPSKVNAWNEYVHRLSDPRADFLILMDGDVLIEHPDSLANMVQALAEDTFASVSGAETRKHLAGRRSWNPLHRISLGASEIRRGMPGTFAGCLYCARATVLRQFRLPRVLIGEDVFVRAMMVTDFFTREDEPRRVITAPDATVLFEAYTSPGQVFRNLKRRAMTLAIDAILFERLWAESTPEEHAGALLIRWDEEDPGWDVRLVQRKLAERRWRTHPWYHVRKWLRRLGRMSPLRAVILFPAALTAGALDTAAEFAANRSLRRGEIGAGWFTTQTNLT